MRLRFTGIAVAACLTMAAPAFAQVKIKFQEVAGGLIHPLAMVSIPDGTGRMAIIEQHGQVRIIDAQGPPAPRSVHRRRPEDGDAAPLLR